MYVKQTDFWMFWPYPSLWCLYLFAWGGEDSWIGTHGRRCCLCFSREEQREGISILLQHAQACGNQGSEENCLFCYSEVLKAVRDAACWQMFYFSPALTRGCHDAATSCGHFSASWYSWDKSVPLNPTPLKDLPLGIDMGPHASKSSPGANSGTGNPATRVCPGFKLLHLKRAGNYSSLTLVNGIHPASASPAHLLPVGNTQVLGTSLCLKNCSSELPTTNRSTSRIKSLKDLGLNKTIFKCSQQ